MGLFKASYFAFTRGMYYILNSYNYARQIEVERGYKKKPSICDLLPYQEWSDEHDVVLLEDGKSVGVCLEALDVPADCRPDEHLKKLHSGITKAFSAAFPLESKDPWVLQLYSFDDYDFSKLYELVVDYVKEKNPLEDSFSHPLVKEHLKVIKEHLDELTQPGGIFTDPLTELPFKGKIRRHRFCFYRRYSTTEPTHDVIKELLMAKDRFKNKLATIGIHSKQLTGKEFYEWQVKHFHRAPAKTNGDVAKLLKRFPYIDPKDRTHGYDFAQRLIHCEVDTTDLGWKFDDTYHKCLVVKDLATKVDIGAVSREMPHGEGKSYALLDKIPEGSMYCIQMVYEDKQTVTKHLEKIEKAAFGKEGVTKTIKQNVQDAFEQMEQKNMLFRCSEAILFVGDGEEDLRHKENVISDLLANMDIDVVPSKEEVYPNDTYIRYLPFNFNYEFDKKHTWRTSYQYADDIARILTIYGRSKGDGQFPLNLKFTRNGEPFIWDQMNKYVRSSNMHEFLLGLTGGGKSVELNQKIINYFAVYNAQIIALEAGDSFGNTMDYCKEMGAKVESVKFSLEKPHAVNPYSEWQHALKTVEAEEEMVRRNEALFADQDAAEEIAIRTSDKLAKEQEGMQDLATDEERQLEENRDILGEMVMATRVMITGGEDKEEEKIGRAEVSQITEGLILTMKKCRDNQVEDMLVSNVEATFRVMATDNTYPEVEREKFQFFARSLERFTKGRRAQFTNRPSKPIPNDFDFLHIDVGFLQQKEYADLMGTVNISMLAKVLSIAEHNQHLGRPTVLILDEVHIFLKVKLIALFLILMIKVARKIGLIIIPSTQNVEDFGSIEAKKVPSMIEHYQVLKCSSDEIKHIQQFRPLTEEDVMLINSIRNEPGVYTEGVWLSSKYKGLYRSVLPKLTLALAMTNPDEKAERRKIEQEHQVSTAEAIKIMASRLGERKEAKGYHRKFL